MNEPWTPGPWETEEVAPDFWLVRQPSGEPLPPTEGNARLIALAPEMAELLQLWLDVAGDLLGNRPVGVDTEDLLARARGESEA